MNIPSRPFHLQNGKKNCTYQAFRNSFVVSLWLSPFWKNPQHYRSHHAWLAAPAPSKKEPIKPKRRINNSCWCPAGDERMTLINHPTGGFLQGDPWFIPTFPEHQQEKAGLTSFCWWGGLPDWPLDIGGATCCFKRTARGESSALARPRVAHTESSHENLVGNCTGISFKAKCEYNIRMPHNTYIYIYIYIYYMVYGK